MGTGDGLDVRAVSSAHTFKDGDVGVGAVGQADLTGEDVTKSMRENGMHSRKLLKQVELNDFLME